MKYLPELKGKGHREELVEEKKEKKDKSSRGQRRQKMIAQKQNTNMPLLPPDASIYSAPASLIQRGEPPLLPISAVPLSF